MAEPVSKAANLLFEIGTEELPPADIEAAQAQLAKVVPEMLDRHILAHAGIKVLATPRRLTGCGR